MWLPVLICATLRIIAAFGMRCLLDELHHVGIPVGIRLVMVCFLPVYGSRLRAHVDQGADNRLDGDDTAHRSSILSEDPGCEQQVSYQIRHPPNSAQKQALEKLDEQLRRITRSKQSRPTSEMGHHHLQQLRHWWISNGRGWGCLCSLQMCESGAYTTINHPSVHQGYKHVHQIA